MSFKEMIKSDIEIFINADEFGEDHKINGNTYSVVVDHDRLQERSKKEFDGISVGEILYFVKADDYGKLPEVNSVQIFDGRQMYVFDSKTDLGVHEIILSQNRGI